MSVRLRTDIAKHVMARHPRESGDWATQPPRPHPEERALARVSKDCAANEFRLHLGGIGALAAIALASTVLASCGVKSDLDRPMTQVMQDTRKDPSKPPVPLGQPGTGTTPPYTTGP